MSNKKQWYAMRSRLQKKGLWKHSVPQQEEGEPPSKKPALEEPEGAQASDPEEGTSQKAQGKYSYIIF